MKKTLSAALFAFIIILSLTVACSKNSNGNSNDNDNSSVPQAGNDDKNGGIYKGTIIGSSGNFIIVLQGGVNKIYVTLDGVKDTLSTQTAITNASPVSRAIFKGKTQMSLTFSVDANGANPVINAISIPNHPNAEAFIVKETSTAQVMIFEGRFTKTTGSANDQCTGTVNFFIVNNSGFIAFYREDILSNPTAAGSFLGSVNDSKINVKVGTSSVVLTINADKTRLTGTFTDTCSSSVNCTRTL